MDKVEMYNNWSAAPHGAKTRVIEHYMNVYNCSKATIMRELAKTYGKKKTVARPHKVDPENFLIMKIIKMKMYGYQGLSGRELATDLCIEILINEGYKEAEFLTVSTVNRRMNELGFRDKDVIVRVEARYANQQHQLDFSRSKYFQCWKFDKVKGDYLLKATSKHLAYKENDSMLRTWWAGVTDAYSRVSLAQCYVATGESVLIGIDFLNFAYTRVDDLHPMIYLPEVLKTDNGAFIKNQTVKMLLQKLNVKSELSTPLKKRGIQKRESAWKLLWRRFELPLLVNRKEGFTIHLADFNELAHEFHIKLLDWNVPGKRKSITRGHAYRTSIAAREQRIISVDMKELLTRPYTRLVGDDLCITIKNQKYQAPRQFQGKQVSAWINLNGEVVAELIEEPGRPVIMPPVDGYVSLGDFSHREAPTFRQQIENDVKQSIPRISAGGNPPPSIEGGQVSYLPVRKREIEVENKFDTAVYADNVPEVFASEFAAKKYIAEQFGRNASYADYAEIFDPLLVDTLKRADIDAVISGVKNKQVAVG
jgi:hypothetical protein